MRRPRSMRRLVKRLGPILGLARSNLTEQQEQDQQPLAFDVGILAYCVEGQAATKFKLASTVLEKDRPVANPQL